MEWYFYKFAEGFIGRKWLRISAKDSANQLEALARPTRDVDVGRDRHIYLASCPENNNPVKRVTASNLVSETIIYYYYYYLRFI